MGYVFNNNQPVVFNYDNGFCGTIQREYCILKENNDRISTQFKLAPLTVNQTINPTFTPSAEKMTNYSFTGSATGWTLTGGWGYGINNVATITAGTVSQAVPGIVANKSYYIEMVFEPTAYGASPNMTLSIGGTTSSNLGTLAVSQLYYASGYFNATNTNNLIVTNNGDWRGIIYSISVKEVGWNVGINGFNWINTVPVTVDWVVSNKAQHTQGNTTVLFIQFLNYIYNLTVGDTYKIVVTVTDVTEGSVGVYLGGTLVGTIDQNGVYIYTGTVTSGSGQTFYFAPTSNFNGSIDNLYAYKIPDNFDIGVFDLDDNFIKLVPSSEITQVGDWVYVETSGSDLSLAEGCYRLKLTDTYETTSYKQLITNGDFSSGGTGWTGTSGVTFGTDATILSADSTDIETLSQTITIDECLLNKSLTGSFELRIDASATLTVTARGKNTLTVYATGTITTSGTKLTAFTPTDDTEIELIFSLVCQAPKVNQDCNIDDVSLFSNGCDLNYLYESNCINIKAEHECTKDFEWYNTKNAFNFNYVDFATKFNLRIHCDFGKWTSKQTWNIWKNYNLNSTVVAGDSTEMFEVKTEMLPENVHRALAIARMHDNFYIDTIETYADATDYEPEWTEKNKNFAIVRFDVWQQGLRTNACGVDLTSPTDEALLIDPITGECVISLE
jgi:hypothetical protein